MGLRVVPRDRRVQLVTTPSSAFSATKKIYSLGKSALKLSEKEELLRRFEVESSEHSLLQLDVLLAAIAQDARESGENTEWLAAASDPSLPTAARLEALSGLRDHFLRTLRASRDPVLGNKMVATVAAGLSRLHYPEPVMARTMAASHRLIPQDIDLLHRYIAEGIEHATETDEGKFMYWPRKLVQEDFILHFIRDDGSLSQPLDGAAYGALKEVHLIRDMPWFQDPERRRGKPPEMLRSFPKTHAPFKLEWRLTQIGQAMIEAFLGHPLTAFLNASDQNNLDGSEGSLVEHDDE